MKCSIDVTATVRDDEGDDFRIEIGPDVDGLGLLEVRYYDHGDKRTEPAARFSVCRDVARKLTEALEVALANNEEVTP